MARPKETKKLNARSWMGSYAPWVQTVFTSRVDHQAVRSWSRFIGVLAGMGRRRRGRAVPLRKVPFVGCPHGRLFPAAQAGPLFYEPAGTAQ